MSYTRPLRWRLRISTLACLICVALLAGALRRSSAASLVALGTPVAGDWMLALNVSGSLGIEAISLPSMWIGIQPEATDSFDIGRDFVAAPPHPDDRMPHAIVQNAAHRSGFRALSVDIRASPKDLEAGATWTLVVDNPSAQPWTLSWDSAQVATFWTGMTLTRGANVVNMRASDAVEIPATSKSVYVVRVRAGANRLPIVAPLRRDIASGIAVDIALVAMDADGDAIAFVVQAGPQHGSAEIVGQTLTYTPAAGFAGTDTIAYAARDSSGVGLSAVITINVTRLNEPPTAKGQTVDAVEDVPVEFRLIAVDGDGDALTYVIAQPPAAGTLSVVGNVALYTPNVDFHGTDSFVFYVDDGQDASDAQLVDIIVASVDDPPALNPLRTLAPIRIGIATPLRTLQLGGSQPLFVDPDSLVQLTVVSSDDTVVTARLDGELLHLDALGVGTATVTIGASGTEAEVSVSVQVVSIDFVNARPQIVPPRSITVVEGEIGTTSIIANDPDGDPVTFAITGFERLDANAGDDPEPEITVDATTGELTFVILAISSARATYRVDVTVTDAISEPVATSVFVFAFPANDPPVIRAPAFVVAYPGEPLTLDVVVSDPDPEDTPTLLAAVRDRELAEAAPVRQALREFNRSDLVRDAATFTKRLQFTPNAELLGRLVIVRWIADDGVVSTAAETQIAVGDSANLPPVIEPIPDQTVQEGATLVVPITAYDPDAEADDPISLTVTELKGAARFDPGQSAVVWEDVPFDQQGTSIHSVVVTDSGGLSSSQTFRISVIDVNRSPELELIEGVLRTGDVQDPMGVALTRRTLTTITVGAVDPDDEEVSLAVQGAPDWVRARLGGSRLAPLLTIDMDPPSDAEDATMIVTAEDSGGLQVSASLILSLSDPPNSPPRMESIASTLAIAGDEVTFVVHATDADGDPIALSVSSLPNGATLDADTFHWQTEISDAREEPYVVIVSADDGRGGVSQAESRIMLVRPPNRPPTLAELSDSSGQEGSVITVDLSDVASDPDGDSVVLSFETTFSDTSLFFDVATSTLTFQTHAAAPNAGAGLYPVSVRATDSLGAEAVRVFLLTVISTDILAHDELAIAAAYVTPRVGTVADSYQFIAIVQHAEEYLGEDPVLTVLSDGAQVDVVPMERVAAGSDLYNTQFTAEIHLNAAEYTFQVEVPVGSEPLITRAEGPSVALSPVEFSAIEISGASGSIDVDFSLIDPNSGIPELMLGEYRQTENSEWTAATLSGATFHVQSGSHHFVWRSDQDVPEAKGEFYQFRIRAGSIGEARSRSFVVANSPPGPPALDSIPPSSEAEITVTGSASVLGAEVILRVGASLVARTRVEEDGRFRFTIGELAAGEHVFSAAVVSHGLESEPSNSQIAVIDPLPPEINIISPARGSVVSSQEALISFHVDFGASRSNPNSVTVLINGRRALMSFDPTTSVFSARKRVFGGRAYIVTARAAKASGLTSVQTWTFLVDLGADDVNPPGAASFEPVGIVSSTNPRIRVALSDGESGIDPDSVKFRLNGFPLDHTFLPGDTRGGVAVAVAASSLVDDAYSVTVDFADRAGNMASAQWVFVVDTSSTDVPDLVIRSVLSAPHQTVLGTFIVVDSSPYTFEGVGEAGTEILFAVNDRLVDSVLVNDEGAWRYDHFITADGTEDIRIYARDLLGNTSPPSEPVTLVYDTRPPEIRFASPLVGAPSGNLRPTFTGTITDRTSGVDPSTVGLTIDGDPVVVDYDAELGVYSYVPETGFNPGTTIETLVTASDFAGRHAEVSASVTFEAGVADVTPPVIMSPTLNDEPLSEGSVAHTRSSRAVVIVALADDFSGVQDVYATFDGQPVEFAVNDGIASIVVTRVGVGDHVIVIRAEDGAGNVSRPTTLRFSRDETATAPELLIPTITRDETIVIVGIRSDSDADVTVFVSGVPVRTLNESATFRTVPVRLRAGANEISARAIDAAGNVSETRSVSLNLDLTPPEIAVLSPVSGATVARDHRLIRFRIDDANGVDIPSTLLTLDGTPVRVDVAADGSLEYTAPNPFEPASTESLGRHVIAIIARDLAGNEARLTSTFVVDDTPPRIEGVVPLPGEIITRLEPVVAVTIVAHDVDLTNTDMLFGPENGTLVSVSAQPNFSSDTLSGQLTYRPALDDQASYEVLVRTTDLVGNTAEVTWVFHVDATTQDDAGPTITVLFPQPGQVIDEVGLDILSFAVGDAAGVQTVTIYVNDPTGSAPLSLGRLVENGLAEFNRKSGVVRIFARRLMAPFQLTRGGFKLDPLELNALERSLTGGQASFDPLELNALERSIAGDSTGTTGLSLQRSLTTNTGTFGTGINTIGVQVLDVEGNSSFVSWPFTIALTPPPRPQITTPIEITNQTVLTLDGIIPALEETAALPITVAIELNGIAAGLAAVLDKVGAFTFEDITLATGENIVSVIAQDAAGNVSERTDPYIISVDVETPVVTLDALPPASNTQILLVTGSITDNYALDLTSVTLHINDSAVPLARTQGAFSEIVALDQEVNTLWVHVVDAAGNEAETDESTIRFDTVAPTTAPSSIEAVPTRDGLGVTLTWSVDPNATAYRLYRSVEPITGVSGLSPIADSVLLPRYMDATVPAARAVYYVVTSIDGAGNSDPSTTSPPLTIGFLTDRSGTISVREGQWSLAIPRGGLFENPVLTGVVELREPADAPLLVGAQNGNGLEIKVRSSSGQTISTFDRAALLTGSIPFDAAIPATVMRMYQLRTDEWAGLPPVVQVSDVRATGEVTQAGVYHIALVPGLGAWDVNADGIVDIIDLVTVARYFGQTVTDHPADVVRDGTVTIADLVSVATHFGDSTESHEVLAAPRVGSPRASMSTRISSRREGLADVVVEIDSPVPIAGYELTVTVRHDALRIARTHIGSLFGSSVFALPARVDGASAQVAAVYLKESDDGLDGRHSGIMARVVVDSANQYSDAEVLAAVSVAEVQLIDAYGRAIDYSVENTRSGEAGYKTRTLPNYPNPFNPETWIPFELSVDADVAVTIYDARGSRIRVLALGRREAGAHSDRERAAHWDGRNDRGEMVASGVYFYEMRAGDYRETRRMVILK